MRPSLRPHRATYAFLEGAAGPGLERCEVARAQDGWLVTSRLELSSPPASTTEVEWHLLPDLSTRILYMSRRDAWGEEHDLELAITGNGVLASRGAPDGPSQVEMGWGPRAELDHLCAVFTTVVLARWDTATEPEREVAAVYIGADDLLPQPLQQRYRVAGKQGRVLIVERRVNAGPGARIEVDADGVVHTWDGLFSLKSSHVLG